MTGSRPGERGARASRSLSTVVSFGAVVALAVFVVTDAGVRGHALFAVRWAPAMAFLVWLFWLLLWRPTVRVDGEGVTIVNVGRTHRMPWARVERVLSGPQLRVLLDDGRRIDCWGGPLPSRRRTSRDGALVPEAVLRMEELREAASPSPAPVVSTWDRVPLIVGAALAVASLLAFALLPA